MKRLVLLVLLFITQILPAQQNYSESPEVNKAMESIWNRGSERGVDMDSLMSIAEKNDFPSILEKIDIVDEILHFKLDTIIAQDTIYRQINVTGITRYYPTKEGRRWFYNCRVEIEKRLLSKPDVLETIVAHELGHVLGFYDEKKREIAIMYGIIVEHEGFLYDVIYIAHKEQRWDEFFDMIKETYKI